LTLEDFDRMAREPIEAEVRASKRGKGIAWEDSHSVEKLDAAPAAGNGI
jgi:hypothetical protein